jgi:hypothetical protein
MSSPKDAEELFDPDAGSQQPEDRVLAPPPKTNDPKALRQKALSDKQRDLQDENDLKAVLATPFGIRLLARIIGGPCGWNAPYYHPSNSQMCEIAGRRSIGFQLEQWICDADLKLWFAVRTELEKLRAKPSIAREATAARSHG